VETKSCHPPLAVFGVEDVETEQKSGVKNEALGIAPPF
jgi:hypothetical protein